MDRLLLMWPPKGGLPGEGDEKYAFAANKPVYGTGDAGRRFYKAFREAAIGAGLKENEVMKALYAYSLDGDTKVICGTRVDDLLYTMEPDYQCIMTNLLEQFEIKETKTSSSVSVVESLSSWKIF